MKFTAGFAIAFVGAVCINIFWAGQDVKMLRAASLYEQCVKAEYGMTPIQWYEDNHKYPVCGN